MKNNYFLFIAVLLSVLPLSARASVSSSSGVFVGADIPSVGSINAVAKIDGTNIRASSITWSDQLIGKGWQKAQQYIELTMACNSNSWQIDIYTNNTGANAGLIQRNGLLSTTSNTSRLPLGWVVSDSTVSITQLGEPGEVIKNNVKNSTGTVAAGWKYVKDKGDNDDPGSTTINESWATAQAGQYTSIIYGNANSINMPYSGTAASPVIIYLESEFTYADLEMRYQSTIWLDLVFQ